MNRDQIAEVIGYRLARLVSRNPMPHMSGDPRKRIPEHERDRFDIACQEAADAIMALDGWQTIDDTPDGDRVLGANFAQGYVSVGFFNAKGEFERVDIQGTPMGIGFYPTHYLPLPQPPGDAG